MSTMKPEDYSERKEQMEGWEIHITTFKLGDIYHCTVDNVSPGANFSRARGATKEEAERVALQKARDRLAATRRFPVES